VSDTAFHQTRMGHIFFEATMPSLVGELARLNANLERLLAVAEVDGSKVASTDPDPKGGQ
jgi:hypothetical protein